MVLNNGTNHTCDKVWPGREALFEDPLIGALVFHQLALLLSAVFVCVAGTVSYWLILDHARHYLKPNEQKHIIRILAMIPVYTVISFFSLLFNEKATVLELVRNCYEACVVASFFTLLCHYIAPDLHEQKEYFRNVDPKPWIFPLNKVKPPRSGLTWFNLIYAGIFQFCITRPFFTLIAIITHTNNRYCVSSTRPQNAHLWIALSQGTFVLIAMYCLAQFYKQVKDDLKCYGPSVKFLCIKLTLFLCFWQTWFLGLLARNNGPLKPSDSLATLDIHVSIPHMLVCFEMTILACISHLAFPWKTYDIDSRPDDAELYACKPGQALLHAIHPWDYVKAAARGFRWLFRGIHHRKSDPSYRRGFNTERQVVENSSIELNLSATNRRNSSACSDPGAIGGLANRTRGTGYASISRHTIG